MIKHVGFIMDGNGRWAKKRGLARLDGHTQGAKTATEIMKACVKRSIPYATFYALSIQNLLRQKEELTHILDLAKDMLTQMTEWVYDNNVRVKAVGLIRFLPEDIREKIREIEEKTSSNTGTQISLCISYGGREEILDTIRNCNIPLHKLTTATLSDLFPLPDVDLVIRTSGEYRTSNFLTWQSAYAEYYFTETCWPDFSVEEMDTALAAYLKRNRRFGMEDVKKKDLPLVGDVVASLRDLTTEYCGNIESIYTELIGRGFEWKPQEASDRDGIARVAMCSNSSISFSFMIDDSLDRLPFEDQKEKLMILSRELSVESIERVNPNALSVFGEMTSSERDAMWHVYQCEHLQRTTLEPFLYRAASFYYYIRMVSTDMLTDEQVLIGSVILSICDDILDEETDVKELHYLTDRHYEIASGAILEVWKKADNSKYRDPLVFVASSILMNRFVRKVPSPKKLGECFMYVYSMVK